MTYPAQESMDRDERGEPSTLGGCFVKTGRGESIDVALRRFKKATQSVLADVRRHEHFEKPSVRRRLKAAIARKRAAKAAGQI